MNLSYVYWLAEWKAEHARKYGENSASRPTGQAIWDAAQAALAEQAQPLTDEMIASEAERRYASWDNGNSDRWIKGFEDGARWRDRMAQHAALRTRPQYDDLADRLEAESYKLDHMFDPSHQEPDPIANLMREAAAALRTKGVDRG